MSETAIVIPVFNGLGGLEGCIPSLAWAEGRGVHVVVVDAGSTDGSVRYLEDVPWVTLVKGDPEMWWSASTNRGCRFSAQRWNIENFCILNHDCQLSEPTFDTLRLHAAAYPTDIVCSRVLAQGSERVVFGGGLVGRTGRLIVRGWGLNESRGNAAEKVSWCGGMGSLIPRELFEALDGFDELVFPHYYGDSDFSFRARQLGRSVWYCPAAVVRNDVRSTGISVPKIGANVAHVITTLTDRRSVFNVRDTVNFYKRHAGWRFITALCAVYGEHLASSAKRVLLGRRA